MRHSLSLFVILCSSILSANAFQAAGVSSRNASSVGKSSATDANANKATASTLHAQAEEEKEGASHTAGVNLVDQKTYLSSIDTLQREIAKANGAEPPKKDDSKDAPVYAIGRFEVPLRIDSSPGLDLTDTYIEQPSDSKETANGDESGESLISPGLVLVTGVQGNAADAGLQALDTIVGVSVKDVEGEGDEAVTKEVYFSTSTNSATLETTAIALQTAMGQALERNKKEIYLEMNRLIAGYYN